MSDLYLHGEALTAEMLRKISLSRLEAWRNGEVDNPMSSGRKDALQKRRREAQDDAGLTVADLRSRAKDIEERRQDLVERFALAAEPITRPDGSDPEGFYRHLAMRYRIYAVETKAPARAIADEAQVPVTTVHRWIREARQRGFLPPGRKGRVG